MMQCLQKICQNDSAYLLVYVAVGLVAAQHGRRNVDSDVNLVRVTFGYSRHRLASVTVTH